MVLRKGGAEANVFLNRGEAWSSKKRDTTSPGKRGHAHMEKTLETVTLVHRLIIAVGLALLLVGISIQSPNLNYANTDQEINTLTSGIAAASEQVDQGYKAIYEGSEL